MEMTRLTDTEFQAISGYVRMKYGLNLDKKQYLIESKLWIELARCKAATYTEYWQMLRADRTGTMEARMIDLLTTGYTYFMREEQHFGFLRDVVLPSLARDRTSPYRVWCAGCSTGQECYTLSMSLMEARLHGVLRVPYGILGTDISQKALATAEKGVYGGADYARLPESWRRSWCDPFLRGEFRVRDQVKEPVSFRVQNLMEPYHPRIPYDLISCRNVLIYFRQTEREKLVRQLVAQLSPGGYLFIGHTETLLDCDIPGLDYVEPAIYRRKGGEG